LPTPGGPSSTTFSPCSMKIRNMEKKWTRQPQYWNLALNQFAIMFEERLPA